MPRTYAIHIYADLANYTAPPRVIAIEPNAVIARHARSTKVHQLNLDPGQWLPLPGQVIRLDELPLDDPEKDVPALESAFVLCINEQRDGWQSWRSVASLHAFGSASRVFVVDRERARLRFGDGINGRVPVVAASGTSNVQLRYLVGGGAAGAVGPTSGAFADWEGPSGATARNLTESIDGREAETIDDARQRSAGQLRRRTRAITRDDFETIALDTPGVAVRRAHAAIGRHPAHPCIAVAGAVTVFVVPDVPREHLDTDVVEDAFVAAPIPDAGMIAAVRAELERARLVGTELFVRAPDYRAVRVRAQVRGNVDSPEALQQRVFQRLQHFLDPIDGGFGEPVRASVVMREVQAALGTQARVTQVAIGLDASEPTETCRSAVIGAHQLVWLKECVLHIDRSAITTSGLK
jgi:predicted phage baseplate assembly protein